MPRRYSHSVAWLLVLAGLGLLIVGAELIVRSGSKLAARLGVPPILIGLTIVAIGTSAPELATAIISTIRGDRDIAVGNLIGSSTFNLTIILGITILAAPIVLDPALILIDLPVMILATFFTGVLMLTGRRIGRREGFVMVAMYLAYLSYLLIARL